MGKRGLSMKQLFLSVVLLCAIISCHQKVFSFNNSQPTFQQISYMQGLPGTNVRQQIQDHYGIMWIAVEAMGICRYDGHKFINYKNDPSDINSISSNFVNDLIEDKSGNIWIATIEGLNKYIRNENKFVSYKHEPGNPNSIYNNVCNRLYFDSDDNLWIGTDDGLSKMNITNETFEHFSVVKKTELKYQHLSIYALFEQSKGIFWLGTNQGLIKYKALSLEYKMWYNSGTSNNEPIHNVINCLVPDDFGNLWVGTFRGLDRFSLETQEFNHWYFCDDDQPFLEREGINNFLIDSDGILWAGTFTKGILLIDPITDHYKRISNENGGEFPLKSNHVKYITEDNVGTFWVGTKFEGIFKLNKSINIFDKWPDRLSVLQELKSKYIYSFFEDKNNVFWVGTKTEGLYRVNTGNHKISNFRFTPSSKNSIASNRIQSVLRDTEGKLWIGTDLELQLMNDKRETFYTIKHTSVNKLFQDNKSTLWVGTLNGIFIINKKLKTAETFSFDEKLSDLFQNNSLNITDITQDSSGLVWFSTRESGLFCYDYQTNKLKHYYSQEGIQGTLNSNMTRFCFEDSRGFIWIGTKAGGLNKFDSSTQTFTNYSMEDGLPSNLVLSIQEDSNGYLWIGTHNGISKFNTEKETFENFNSDYGLASNISEPGANWKFSDGELLFGGNDGFNIFYPNDIKKIESITPILITEVKVLDRLVKHDIDSFAFIENSYNENFLSFEFTLMDFNYPYRHEYEYMLDGFDEHWTNNGNRNYASYTSIPPGDYTFRVKAANELGNWSNSVPVCRILIKPPLYKTLWFRLLALVFVVSLALIIYIRKSRLIKNTKVKLEGMIMERTHKLEKAYDEMLEKNKLISKQKKEIELHHSVLEHKVLERTHDLELAKKRAEESDHLKSSFLANMSHEIRTPLNAICGFSSLMNDESTDGAMREKYTEIINNNSNQLLHLIEDILDISKIEVGQLKMVFSTFNVNQLLTEIYTVYIEDLKKKGKNDVKLICPVIENNRLNIELYSDLLRLKQVLVNLINNAIKFTSAGYIEFGYKIEDGFVKFYVKDTGIGISKDNLALVFNRFTKVEKRNTIYGGIGIGLSISKSIVKLIGGEISVDSKQGIGTIFRFTVPYIDKKEN